mgnify:CR=1 FL=1
MKYLIECRMVEGSRHPCCKTMFQTGAARGCDTDARRHGGLDGGRQCSDRGRCCVPRYQPCWSCRKLENGGMKALMGFLGMDGV